MTLPESPFLTERFEQAFLFANRLHATQNRKGSNTPYIAHLLGVTALVLDNGGGEDEAIAALLHDAVEDQGGMPVLDEIRRRFGERVAALVADLTDAFETPKPPWRQRKVDYIQRMRAASPEARLISLADKLYNARSILRDLQIDGDDVWKRFNGGKTGTLWYYCTLVEVYKETGSDFLTQELERVVDKLMELARKGEGINHEGH